MGWILILNKNRDNKKETLAGLFFYYLAEAFLRARASLDFFREAWFLVIVFIFAALSRALYAFGSDFVASATLPSLIRSLIFFTSVFRFRFRRRLKTAFRSEALSAFFAPFIIGIVSPMYQFCIKKQPLINYVIRGCKDMLDLRFFFNKDNSVIPLCIKSKF